MGNLEPQRFAFLAWFNILSFTGIFIFNSIYFRWVYFSYRRDVSMQMPTLFLQLLVHNQATLTLRNSRSFFIWALLLEFWSLSVFSGRSLDNLNMLNQHQVCETTTTTTKTSQTSGFMTYVLQYPNFRLV